MCVKSFRDENPNPQKDLFLEAQDFDQALSLTSQADPYQRYIDPERKAQCAAISDRQDKDRDRPRHE